MKKTATKEKKIFFRDDEHTFTLLERFAKEQDRTISGLVRHYVHEGLMRDSRKRPK